MGRLLGRFVLFVFIFFTVFASGITHALEFGEDGKASDAMFNAGVAQLTARLRQMEAGPALWQEIWLYGALLSPELSKERLTARMPVFKGKGVTRISTAEMGWWVLAAWECAKQDGRREFFNVIQPPAQYLIEESEKRLRGRSHQTLELNLLIAQAWRVVGWLEGTMQHRGRALYCESRYQQLRGLAEPQMNGEKNPRLLAMATLWAPVPGHTSEAFAQIAAENNAEKTGVEVIHLLRDVYGSRLYADELAFEADRPCSSGHSQPLLLQGLDYREARLNVRLSGCGNRASVKLDGKSTVRVPGGISGPHEVVVQLH